MENTSETVQLEGKGADLSSNVLISYAKDRRYLEDCRVLLAKILEWVYPSLATHTANLTTTSWLMSAALYAWLVIRKRGRTIGMEASGLKFRVLPVDQNSVNKQSSRGTYRVATTTTATTVLAMALASYYWVRLRRQGRDGEESQEGSRETTTTEATMDLLSLRGNQRRQVFERQRQQMIARAQQQIQQQQQQHVNGTTTAAMRSQAIPQNSQPPPYADSQPLTTTARMGQSSTGLRMILRQWKRLGVECLRSIATTLSACASGGPHDLPPNSNGATLAQTPVSGFSWGYWLVRLQIAYHCLGGRLYIWLPNSTVQTKSSTQSPSSPLSSSTEQRLRSPPDSQSVRVLGLLILAHAAGEFVRFLTRFNIQWAVRWYVHPQPPSSNTIHSEANCEDLASTAATHRTQDDLPPSSLSAKGSSSAPAVLCSICQEPRKHPSCFVRCGHVFCWRCLQQWVASKTECPVCRTSCRPQDILPLQNYVPLHAASSSNHLSRGSG